MSNEKNRWAIDRYVDGHRFYFTGYINGRAVWLDSRDTAIIYTDVNAATFAMDHLLDRKEGGLVCIISDDESIGFNFT